MKDYKNKCIDCQCKVDNRTKRCSICYKKWREETKEQRKKEFREYQKKWYEENKPRILVKALERSKNLPFAKRKDYIIRSKYGIGIEEYNSMLEKCDNQCQVCGKPHSEEKPLHIDHDHKTGKVRGLLCNSCNYGLGFFKDDIEIMKKATKYLENEIQ